MPDTYNLSQNYAIELILADLLLMESGKDPLLSLLPPIAKDESKVVWDQPENGFGLLSLRGLDASPDITKVPGFRQYSMEPGYYGEKTLINEKQLTVQREFGTPNVPMETEFLITHGIMQLSMRCVDQMRNIIATLFRTGRFVVRNRTGSVTHADAIDGFNLLTPSVPWSNAALATPIDDMLAWKNTLQTGTSSEFGESSQFMMSDGSVNELFATSQLRDKFRLTYGSSPMGLEGVNSILNAYGLPKIVPYNKGYYATQALAEARGAANFTKFLPSRTAIWVGKRPEGVPIGNFIFTRCLVGKSPTGGAPDYSYENGNVKNGISENVYTTLDYINKAPVRVEIDLGFNGGPAVRYPSALAGIYW